MGKGFATWKQEMIKKEKKKKQGLLRTGKVPWIELVDIQNRYDSLNLPE